MDISQQPNTKRGSTPQRPRGSPYRITQNRTFAFPPFPRIIGQNPGKTFSNSLAQGGSKNADTVIDARVKRLEMILNINGDAANNDDSDNNVVKIQRAMGEVKKMLLDM